MNPGGLVRGIAAALLCASATILHAEDFPSRLVTLVVPFAAGSVTDNVTRALVPAMQEFLGQTIIVENKVGAQGTVGAAYVARSKPDGYTLLVASSGMFVAKSFYKSLPYDPNESFQPVSGVGSTSMMFMVAESSPIKSLADLASAVQRGQPPVTMGFGSPSGQVAVALLSSVIKGTPVPVSYRSIPQVLTDALGGHVQVAVADIGNGVAQMRSSKMRGLAISAAARSAAAPDVPTLQEMFPGARGSVETFIAVQAPANTPAAIVERLDTAIRAALVRPEVKARLAALTVAVLPLSATETARRIKTDNPQWEALIKQAGMEPE